MSKVCREGMERTEKYATAKDGTFVCHRRDCGL